MLLQKEVLQRRPLNRPGLVNRDSHLYRLCQTTVWPKGRKPLARNVQKQCRTREEEEEEEEEEGGEEEEVRRRPLRVTDSRMLFQCSIQELPPIPLTRGTPERPQLSESGRRSQRRTKQGRT